MNSPPRLAQYVQPNVPESRVAQQWARLSNAERTARPRAPTMLRNFAYALAVVSIVLFGVHWYRSAPITMRGVTVESEKPGGQSLVLPDGSRVDLPTGSLVVLDEYSDARVRMTLKRGEATFQVAPQKGRLFCVDVQGYEIRVVGTRFSVAVEQSQGEPNVTVRVMKGKVAVRDHRSPNDESILTASQSWSARSTPAVVDAGLQEPAAARGVETVIGELDGGTPTVSPNTTQVSPPRARELLEKAEFLRLEGRIRESSDMLDRLRHAYRGDPRAGLAAFELGRIRMDSFGDLNGAEEALRDAIALSPNASFREDAQSRLVQIYHRQGNLGRCRAAKSAYVARYPNGAASKVVIRLCDP